MISARVVLIIVMAVKLIYDIILDYLADKKRKEPLPEEVADIYDSERYEKYLSRVSDMKKLSHVTTAVDLLLNIILIFSPVYTYFERASGGNAYLTVLYTYLLIWGVTLIPDIVKEYYVTFVIEVKYELNKKSLGEFVKDVALAQLLQTFLMVVLFGVIVFIGEHMALWTNNYSVGYEKSLIICLIIIAALFVIFVALQYVSYGVLRLQYTFKVLEEGELRTKIEALCKGSKKKINNIYVYNESKKSVRKNAFLLKILFRREFGIADNFMEENSERELLAVLSHEAGHLKHKKNFLNYLGYSRYVLLVLLLFYVIANPSAVFFINDWTKESFSISNTNYYLVLLVISSVLSPVFYLSGIFDTYRTREEEYEADLNAVKEGYGEELISTFKNLSSDELINVNPHPVIEFLEYDHPGMYRRIKTIREKISIKND